MKHVWQRFFALPQKKGFLLLELLLALLIFVGVVSGIALHYAQAYALYNDARARHKMLVAVSTVLETMRSTRQLIPHTTLDSGATIMVTPREKDLSAHSSVRAHNLTLVEAVATWRTTTGKTTARFVTCMNLEKGIA